MTYARKTLVSLTDTPYYHVVARWLNHLQLHAKVLGQSWVGEGYARRSCSIGDLAAAILSATSRSLLVS